MARPARFIQYGLARVIDLDSVTAVVQGHDTVNIYLCGQDGAFLIDVPASCTAAEMHRRLVAKVWGGCTDDLFEGACEDEDEDEEYGPYPYLDEEAARAYGSGLTAIVRQMLDKAAARLHPADKREGQG